MSGPRVLVIGWIGSPNLGDELIAESTCEMLRAEGCEPAVATIDENASERLGVPMIRHARARDTWPLARSLRHHHGVIFGGGGLIQDETGPWNLPFHLARLGASRLTRRPWAGLALGVGEVRRRTGRMLVRSVMRGATAVSVRDAASAARYRQLTGEPVLVAADPVLSLTPQAVEPTAHLVVSLRRPNRPGQRSVAAGSAPDTAQLRSWAGTIDSLAESRSLEVRFVAWDREIDDPLHRAVASLLRRPAEVEAPPAERVIERMGAGRLVLTMRYHGAISALLHNRPGVLLDYSPKMADLAGESGGALVAVPVRADKQVISTGFDAAARRLDQSREALRRLRERGAVNRQVVSALAEASRRRTTGG